MKLRDFKPGTIVSRNVIVNAEKNDVRPVFAVVPPVDHVMNKELVSATENINYVLLGVNTDYDVCQTIYSGPEIDDWDQPSGFDAMRIRCMLVNAGFKILKEDYDMSVCSILKAIRLIEVQAPNGKPVYVQNLKEFDKVVARANSNSVWSANFYSHFDSKNAIHYMIGNVPMRECLPYKGNEKLINTKLKV